MKSSILREKFQNLFSGFDRLRWSPPVDSLWTGRCFNWRAQKDVLKSKFVNSEYSSLPNPLLPQFSQTHYYLLYLYTRNEQTSPLLNFIIISSRFHFFIQANYSCHFLHQTPPLKKSWFGFVFWRFLPEKRRKMWVLVIYTVFVFKVALPRLELKKLL